MNISKITFLLFLTVLLSACRTAGPSGAQGTETTTVFLVRHAEKGPGADPELTADGLLRAQLLARMLQEVPLSAVYSTNFLRTRQTAAPTADNQDLEVELYDHRDLPAFARRILKDHEGETILVVGHSNTTPTLTGLLDEANEYPAIDEMDYGNLFLVNLPKGREAHVIKLRF